MKKNKWKPKNGDIVWCVYYKSVPMDLYYHENDIESKRLYKIGNMFKTKGEATKMSKLFLKLLKKGI